ncbi:MAG TPA: DUF4198 domain-containing protein [bacterium]|nr:DUF4198 domain-containing protein [bacterium]
MRPRPAAVRWIVLLAGFLFFISVVRAHYNWIVPIQTVVEKGETVEVQLTTGHAFPVGEAGPSTEHLKAFVRLPSGEITALEWTEQEKYLQASVHVHENGLYTVYFESDRGIISRTAEGWKSGGIDRHPGAASSMNYYASCLAHIATRPSFYTSSSPIGLKCELTFAVEKKRIVLTALQNGSPVKDTEISLLKPGADQSEPIGKTDSSGQLIFSTKKIKGPVLFIASYQKSVPEGNNYQYDLFRSTLYVELK